MSGIIEGYNYDIFISYRQKDNLPSLSSGRQANGDRWVSNFVEALKTELEATFKEDVSVYFDENPHDRLQETHNVDKSLEGKLKCLIFIPILSQTYCDPNSYAWQHEFLAFLRMVENDPFGKDIKLRGGNVAGRILPIRIHDLEPEDIKLFEKETGSVLRALDFVFKTASGVSRPLISNEDHPNDNLNRTYYRDQMNKVAHAIKEIITAIKIHNQPPEEVLKQESVTKPQTKKNLITKIIAGSIIALTLILTGFLLFPKLFPPEGKLEKSIAVLPFINLSNEPEQEYFSDGVVEAILNHLFKVGELKVISSTSTKRYKNTELSIKEIARELGVSSILEGSVQKIGNNIRITAQLIDARKDIHLWSEIYDKNIADIFLIQSEVAQNIAKELKITLTSEENDQINRRETENPEAYKLYLQGRHNWNKRTKEGLNKSAEYFQKAIDYDTTYALAYAGLADTYFIQAYWGWIPWAEGTDKAKTTVLKALAIDKNLSEAHTVLGALLNYKEWKWEEARKELKTAVDLNPNFVTAHHYYSELLDILLENKEARTHINIALEIDPFLPVLHVLSSRYYYNEGKLKEAIDECLIMEELDPEYGNRLNYWREFYIYSDLKEGLKAVVAAQKALYNDTLNAEDPSRVLDIYNNSGMDGLWKMLIDSEINKAEPSVYNLAQMYAKTGKKENALKCLEKTFENPPPGFVQINNNPDFDYLRFEPEFQTIIKKMGLSDYQTPR